MSTSPQPELPRNLTDRLPPGERDADLLFDIFVDWVTDRSFELYPAQEEAIIEVFAGNHVVLNTPTGSGKSLVALAMHFYSFATGGVSYYTSPIKALVSEKFFDLCKHFGPENVAMFTGDASINKGAPIVCCTAEILAEIALSDGSAANVQHAILDEFHYYGDRERGMAWQLPLLLLPQTSFLLMSATLGDTSHISSQLEERSGREVALVKSTDRPVPLEYVWSVEPLTNQIEELEGKGLSPIYVVNFTQRECAELAQSLTSINFCSKDEKQAIKDEIDGSAFDTPYGKTVRKYVQHGVALHHGGLLPKYRMLVERLAQMGLLKIVCGTDTLGVGINLPIRTVLFSKLCKYDGEKVRLLRVRDFKQIAGRAGRKGYDTRGLVVAQAPDHVIENLKIDAKIAGDAKKAKKLKKKGPPDRGYVHWDEETFERLHSGESEPLKSRFTVNHAMLLTLLQRPDPSQGGYRAMIDLIALSHESSGKKSRLRRKARHLFQSLRQAEILELAPRDDGKRGQQVQLHSELQHDFSIHHSLSLFLVDVAGRLNAEAPDFHITTLSFVEAILEDPWVVLNQQREKARSAAYQQMKADGIEYDERQEKLEKITYPMPDADVILDAFHGFAQLHPWIAGFTPSPKSIVRDMYERYSTFNEYVNLYGLERSEGVLLRHISQTYKTLKQNVPEQFKTDAVHELIAYLREVINRADSSLVQEWERMMGIGGAEGGEADEGPPALDADERAFKARVRAELRAIVGALAADDLEEAAGLLRQVAGDTWSPMRIERELAPYLEEYDRILFDHASRATSLTRITRDGPGKWAVTQVLCDPEGHNEWYLRGRVDLDKIPDPEGRLFALEELSGA